MLGHPAALVLGSGHPASPPPPLAVWSTAAFPSAICTDLSAASMSPQGPLAASSAAARLAIPPPRGLVSDDTPGRLFVQTRLQRRRSLQAALHHFAARRGTPSASPRAVGHLAPSPRAIGRLAPVPRAIGRLAPSLRAMVA